MRRLLFISLLCLLGTVPALAQTATITWGTTYQTIDGFGASDAFGSGMTSAQQTLFFTTAGFSLLRTEIPDDGSCTSVQLSCAGPVLSDMSAAQAAGAGVWSTPWSAPASMKTNGSVDCSAGAGSGTLSSGSFGAYATYLSNYIASVAAQGITLKGISVVNEPDYCPSYDGMLMSASQLDTFIGTNLGPTLASASQTGTWVIFPETADWANLPTYAGTCIADSTCAQYVTATAAHDYDTFNCPSNPTTCAYPAAQNIGKHLWQTEVSDFSACDTSMTDALTWVQDIHNWLTIGQANAWLYWWLVNYGGSGDNEGLICTNGSVRQLVYAMGNYAKFVRPGWVMMEATYNPQSGVYVSAYKNSANGNYAIVAINQNGSSTSQTFTLSGVSSSSVTPWITSASLQLAQQSAVSLSSNAFTYALPAYSVTTFVGASGGSSSGCPTGANYLNTAATPPTLTTLSALGVTNCYYIAASGSDSNDGLSEASGHPWLHAPGMPSATSNAASHTIAAGDGYIFRGGDTWHFGASTSPSVGGAWSTSNSGTLTNPIYIGVDQTWYTGGSWARPIMTGDNPTSTSTSLGPCAYQISGGNNMWIFSGSSHYILDNLELTGVCQESINSPNGQDQYIAYGSSSDMRFLRLYIHGWTHEQFGNPSDPADCDGGTTICFNLRIFAGGGNPTLPDDVFRYVVVDGSDSDPAGLLETCYCDFWDVAYSYFGNHSGIITRYAHLFHDNLYEYWYENGHGNVLESVNFSDAPGTNALYNSVFRHVNTNNGAGDPGFWASPPVGTTNYVFNNISYDWTNMEYYNVGQNAGNQGTMILFNNTFQYNPLDMGAGNILSWDCPRAYANPLYASSDHYITNGASAYPSCSPTSGGYTTELLMSNSVATSDGYTGSQTYAYSPTSATSPTVGTGTNRLAYCTALSSAGLAAAATACQSDTSYGITYNSTSHTVSTTPARTVVARPLSGAWDQGAYEFSSSPPPPASAPQITPIILGQGTVGTAYPPVTLAATGGSPPYTWTGSGFPSGLSLSAAGVLSGTPTAAGTFNLTFTVKDSKALTGSYSTTLTIVAAPTLYIGSVKLNNATVTSLSFSTPYASQTLKVIDTDPGAAAVSIASNQSWLTVSPASGSTAFNTTVSVNTSGLASGAHNGVLTFTSPAWSNSPLAIPVTLTIPSPTMTTTCAWLADNVTWQCNSVTANVSKGQAIKSVVTTGTITNTTTGVHP